MQHRMKTHQLTEKQIEELLLRTPTGSLATVNPDGTPYVTPVHFVLMNKLVYFHGLPKGQKIENIKANPNVSMMIYEAESSLLLDPDGKPCDTNTKYQSVVFSGTAAILDDRQQKREILSAIVKKYTPGLEGTELPDNMVKGTAVVQIMIRGLSGKYYE